MEKWIIDNYEFESVDDVSLYITENLDESYYDKMLDDCYDEIEICGLSYAPSLALYRVDEVAYRCGMNDYYDTLRGDIEYELERMCDGEEQEFYGYTVEYIEEEDDDDDDK